ncbi:hypothetical protein KAM344_39490 [Aeromonas caviae]|jgi:hypothetical protein|uniref:hypothetical protein n=1 Tax=Aeromonas TaxID=642 RepID=UPI001CC5C59C|nr:MULTISPECIES: hypothetical protein [Aeromonas]HEH9415734.1 hypothetical protein [Aeromonas salmonicida]MCE9925312.1 hypothetical protein [Aeromonas media]GJB05019.1 hypothetical protein KAM360_39620 [Aeromonas caviae]GKQ68784.1 hypothetical protein KAM344_39490 [Aeromonas caviae]HEH9424552.1 hypothetical protein [Aeromonas salmonicida]
MNIKPRSGRPQKSADEKRSLILRISFNAAEQRVLTKHSKTYGIPKKSSLIRFLALREPDSNISPDFSYDDRVRLLEGLYNISSNLNQIMLLIRQAEAEVGSDVYKLITDSSDNSPVMQAFSSINSLFVGIEKALIGVKLK